MASVKLPNCAPFQIRADELAKLYAEIKDHGHLQLECLSSEVSGHSTRTGFLSLVPDLSKIGAKLRSPEDNARNNVTRYNNLGNSLKRSKDVFDYSEQDQNDVKHPKLSRNPAPTAGTQRPAGDFNRVLDSLHADLENADNAEPHRSPRNSLASKPDSQPANPLGLDFENDAPSPTDGFNIKNLKHTLDYIKEIN